MQLNFYYLVQEKRSKRRQKIRSQDQDGWEMGQHDRGNGSRSKNLQLMVVFIAFWEGHVHRSINVSGVWDIFFCLEKICVNRDISPDTRKLVYCNISAIFSKFSIFHCFVAHCISFQGLVCFFLAHFSFNKVHGNAVPTFLYIIYPWTGSLLKLTIMRAGSYVQKNL